MKNFLILGAVAMILSSCGEGTSTGSGQGRSASSFGSGGALPFAAGPINQACLTSDRSARSRSLCGCIQAVADRSLSGADQSRAVAFYSNPQQAQDVRQSDRANDERFWKAYRAYGDRAEQVCR